MSSNMSKINNHRHNWYFLSATLIISSCILFFCSSVRHLLFQSNALDLGWFDQGIYLISQGKPPIVSFVGFHILGDHAALILYIIALLYKIYPSVYWLFAIQAIALSLGIIPLWYLALNAGLQKAQARALVFIYLFYPLIFNVNLFDFHPDVFVVSGLLLAILAAQNNSLLWFSVAIVLILSSKAIFSLTVLGLGLWLLISQRKLLLGIIGVITGIAWFLIATQVIIPHYTGTDAAIEMADSRYAYLGDSLGEIIKNLFLRPQLVFGHLFTLANLEYLILLLIPLSGGLSRYSLHLLMPAFPALSLNLLTDYLPQKDLIHQYSLPILPFLLVGVIATWVHGKGFLRKPKWLIVWSIIAFIAFAKYGYFGSLYLQSLDTYRATKQAINLIQTPGGVLTSSSIAPHLTHRPLIKLAIEGVQSLDLNQFDYILLNQRHPGWASSPELVSDLITKINQNPNFVLLQKQDDVFLYHRQNQL